MNGLDCDDLHCNWVSKGETVNSWLEINFNQARDVIRIDVQQRPNAADQCSGLRIDLSSGSPETVS